MQKSGHQMLLRKAPMPGISQTNFGPTQYASYYDVKQFWVSFLQTPMWVVIKNDDQDCKQQYTYATGKVYLGVSVVGFVQRFIS